MYSLKIFFETSVIYLVLSWSKRINFSNSGLTPVNKEKWRGSSAFGYRQETWHGFSALGYRQEKWHGFSVFGHNPSEWDIRKACGTNQIHYSSSNNRELLLMNNSLLEVVVCDPGPPHNKQQFGTGRHKWPVTK